MDIIKFIDKLRQEKEKELERVSKLEPSKEFVAFDRAYLTGYVNCLIAIQRKIEGLS